MRNKFFIGLVLLSVLIFTMPAMALTTPSVSKNHGVVTLMLSGSRGIVVGGEYGVTEQLAVAGKLSSYHSKFGLKYQIAPNFALQGGMQSWGSSPVLYLGINGGAPIAKDLTGIVELNLITPSSNTYFSYDLGVRYKLASPIDIRAGLSGYLSPSTSTALQIGIGYGF